MIKIYRIEEQKPEPWCGEYYIRLLREKCPSETNKARQIIRTDLLRFPTQTREGQPLEPPPAF